MPSPTTTQKIVLCSLFAALLGVFSQIAIPLGPVPINMATLVVYTGAALMGGRLMALSALLWAGLGLAGLPVFALFQGGFSVLVGPTGGFAIGYLPMALICGSLLHLLGKKPSKILSFFLPMVMGITVCFLFGTVWFMIVTHTGFLPALALCVWPFIPGEIIKQILSFFIVKRVKPFIR